MNKEKISFVVGLFVIVGFMILAFMILKLNNYGYAKNSYAIAAVFNYANGVVVGAPVHFAGVEVGKVSSIYLNQTDEVKVELNLAIFKETIIREDAIVKINSAGLVGERYVDIFPRSKNAAIIRPGAVLIGEEPIPFSEMVSRIKVLVSTVEDYFAQATSQQNRDKLEETIKNVHTISQNLVEVAAKIDILIDKNKDKLTEGIADFNDSAKVLKEIVADNETDIDQTIKDIGTSFKQFKHLMECLATPFEKLKEGEGTVGKLIHSDELYDHMNYLLNDLEENPWKLLKKSKKKKK